jgi:hypothetical protein
MHICKERRSLDSKRTLSWSLRRQQSHGGQSLIAAQKHQGRLERRLAFGRGLDHGRSDGIRWWTLDSIRISWDLACDFLTFWSHFLHINLCQHKQCKCLLICCPRLLFYPFFCFLPQYILVLLRRLPVCALSMDHSIQLNFSFCGANLSEGMACLTCLAKPGAIVLCSVSLAFEASSSPHLVSSLLRLTFCQCGRLVLSLRGFSVCVAGKFFYCLVCQLSLTAVWS